MKRGLKRASGFTLIELLVVIGIIALLISILLPALGAAKKQARVAETTAELTGLSHCIDTYFTTFNAYPGPASYTTTTAAVGSKISGTQNLLLGLTYAMVSTAPTVNVTVPGSSSPTLYVDPTSQSGPQDRGAVSPSGSGFRQYTPFFSPAGRELSASNGAATPVWPAGGVSGGTNAFAFPVILDRFPDAMPVLYYRRNAGVDTPIAIQATNSAAGGYNYQDNIEYTTATALKASTGATYSQTLAPATAFALADLTTIATSTGTSNARGGYILISAGPDRFYGSVAGKSDNIVVVGGQ